jgi:hypothetical protein
MTYLVGLGVLLDLGDDNLSVLGVDTDRLEISFASLTIPAFDSPWSW